MQAAKSVINCATCQNWQQEEGRDIEERGECRLAARNFVTFKETGELRTMAAQTFYTEWTFFCQQHTPKETT